MVAKPAIKLVKAAVSVDFSGDAASFDGPDVVFAEDAPSFDAGDVSFDDIPAAEDEIYVDPLAAVVYTGNVEVDAKAEVSALLQAFRDRAKKEQDRRMAATDSEFWFAVCFETRAQKDEFLSKLGLIAHVHGDKYIDGSVLAAKLGITLTPVDVSYREPRIDPKFASLSLPIGTQ